MVSNVRNRWNISHYSRFVSVTTLISYIFAAMPVRGFCHDSINGIYIQDPFDHQRFDLLLSKFNEIKQCFRFSENRNLEALKSFQSFLDEIHATCDVTLTIHDACEMAKIFIKDANMDENIRPLLSQIIHNLQISHFALEQTMGESLPEEYILSSKHLEIFGYGVYAPWEWSWFGLNKKHKEHDHSKFICKQMTYGGPIPEDDGSIPDDLIICGIEALVIGLLLIIPSGYTQALAVAIAYDMGTRGIEALKQVSDMNKERQKDFRYPQENR